MSSPIKKIEFFSSRKAKLKTIENEEEIKTVLRNINRKKVILAVTHKDNTISACTLSKVDNGYEVLAATGELSYLVEDDKYVIEV